MARTGDVVFQNQRYYGIVWRPPALLDRPGWSDEAGQPVDLQEPPSEESGLWRVETDPSTDADGWCYASAFNRLPAPRPGGRAGMRAGDFVRRRKWVRLETQVEAAVERELLRETAAVESLVSPVTQMRGPRVRRQTETERRKAAVRTFFGLLANTIKRRQLWGVMPLDPSAWYVMLTRHQAQLLADQDAALAAAPPPADDPASRARARELMCAAVHARAAYGHAMAAGHLASLLDFALLQTVHQLRFDPVGGASAQANTDAAAALSGVPLEDVRLAEWHNSVSRPCHYLAVDRAHGCLVLAVRGSLEVSDILSDLSAAPLEIFGLLDAEGLAHEGLMAAATYVHCNTAGALASLAAAHPGWPLLVTGHSMGGSVATILALLIRSAPPQQMGPVRAIALGAAPVFSRHLASLCDGFVTSVVLGADVIPRVDYASVEGLMLDYADSSPLLSLGRKVRDALAGLKVGWPSLPKPPALGLKTPSLPSLSGLRGFAGLADNEQATANAARAAESAAAAMSPPSDSGSVELTERRAGGREASRAFAFPGSVSSSARQAAAEKLERLRAQAAQGQAEAGCAAERQEAETDAAHQQAAERAAEKAPGDHTGIHPEPLYLAGKVLWLLPPKLGPADGDANGATAPSDPGIQAQLDGAPDRLAAAAELREGADNATELEVLNASEAAFLHGRQSAEAARRSPPAPSSAGRKRPAHELEGPSKRAERQRSQHFPSLAVEDSSADSAGEGGSREVGGEAAAEAMDAAADAVGAGGQARPPPVVLEVARERFGRILLTIDLMNDHLPDSYLTAISRL